MRILVTGGSGFLGGAIVRQLELSGRITDSDDLFIADIKKLNYETNAHFCALDVFNSEQVKDFTPFDIVFHLAGLLGSETLFDNIKQTEFVNVIGTINILDLQKDYGFILQPGLLGDWLNPYMISKRTAERYGLMYRKWYKTKYVSIRPTDIYGPEQSLKQKKITPTFVMQALRNEPLTVYGSGEYKVRMNYVTDVAKFFVDIALKEIDMFPTIDLGSLLETNHLSVNDYAEIIIKLCGSSSEITHIPMRIGQPDNVEDAKIDLYQTARMSDMIGWDETPLQNGLLETIEYYRKLI